LAFIFCFDATLNKNNLALDF